MIRPQRLLEDRQRFPQEAHALLHGSSLAADASEVHEHICQLRIACRQRGSLHGHQLPQARFCLAAFPGVAIQRDQVLQEPDHLALACRIEAQDLERLLIVRLALVIAFQQTEHAAAIQQCDAKVRICRSALRAGEIDDLLQHLQRLRIQLLLKQLEAEAV